MYTKRDIQTIYTDIANPALSCGGKSCYCDRL